MFSAIQVVLGKAGPMTTSFLHDKWRNVIFSGSARRQRRVGESGGVLYDRPLLPVSLLAPHQGEPGSIPGRVTTGFSHVGIVLDDAVCRRVFSEVSRFPPPFSIPPLLHAHLNRPHRLSRPLCQELPKYLLLVTSLANPLRLKEREWHSKEAGIAAVSDRCDKVLAGEKKDESIVVKVFRVISGMEFRPALTRTRGGAGGKRGDPDKRHRPARFPLAKNSGADRPRIEPGSPWWEASSLTARLPWTLRSGRRDPASWFDVRPIILYLLSEEVAVGRAVSLLASHLGEPGSIPGLVTPGFSQVGIVPDDAAGRRVFSGIFSFSHLFFLALFHTHLSSPSSALKISTLRAAQIFSLNSYSNYLQAYMSIGYLRTSVFPLEPAVVMLLPCSETRRGIEQLNIQKCNCRLLLNGCHAPAALMIPLIDYRRQASGTHQEPEIRSVGYHALLAAEEIITRDRDRALAKLKPSCAFPRVRYL
ncbi:hypothetical protein PR048_026303 [Dryococelus australis]|uniref:Uncharacterized protein n=1 Tax=Dryococelus australis TaxID=614101 RepID=A0ABQ9GKY1_9NEOP|nr:hypothetical protein PR048_026303 [Dryococelus australis]